MSKKSKANSQQKPKKRGGKINKAQKNKKKRSSRKPTIHWTMEQIIQHYISNIKYTVSIRNKKPSWEKVKPKQFFNFLEDQMKRFLGRNGKTSRQIKSRDSGLKLQHYKYAEQSKKIDLADHSYCCLMNYLQKAQGRQKNDRMEVQRMKRVSKVLEQYQNLLERKKWPNPWEQHRHHLFPQEENKSVQEQNPPASIPISNPPAQNPMPMEEFKKHMGMKYLKRREYFCPHLRRVSVRELKQFPDDDYGDEEDGHGDRAAKVESSEEEPGQIEDKGKHLKKLAKRKGELKGNPRKKRDE